MFLSSSLLPFSSQSSTFLVSLSPSDSSFYFLLTDSLSLPLTCSNDVSFSRLLMLIFSWNGDFPLYLQPYNRNLSLSLLQNFDSPPSVPIRVPIKPPLTRVSSHLPLNPGHLLSSCFLLTRSIPYFRPCISRLCPIHISYAFSLFRSALPRSLLGQLSSRLPDPYARPRLLSSSRYIQRDSFILKFISNCYQQIPNFRCLCPFRPVMKQVFFVVM